MTADAPEIGGISERETPEKAAVVQLRVSRLTSPSPDELPFEIVERKGHGHLDTLCDSLAESASIGLSRYYLEHFGAILHHNVDKALLLGGVARPAFGGGKVLKPIEITVACAFVGRYECHRPWASPNRRRVAQRPLLAHSLRRGNLLRTGSAA